MSDNETPIKGRLDKSRRGFLAKVGATGLVAAAAVFGRSTPAFAANYGCCNLAFSPSINVPQCQSGSNYTWGCALSNTPPRSVCYCCEKKNSSGAYVASAYSCQYI
jgi:hypothetical protein